MVGKKWKRGELNSFLNEDEKVQIKDNFVDGIYIRMQTTLDFCLKTFEIILIAKELLTRQIVIIYYLMN